jgi:hypothetical protein
MLYAGIVIKNSLKLIKLYDKYNEIIIFTIWTISY